MKTWREIQKESFTKLGELTSFLEFTEETLERVDFSPQFPLLLPLRLAQKIPKNCLDHPIARQFIPLKEEKIDKEGFTADPLGEESGVRVAPAALHKYPGRILLVTSGACAMHCRYCFRQNFTYDSNDKKFIEELEYIRNNSTLHEVILSGGDPLSLSDNVLEHLLTSLDQIPHIKIIRFHTRFPIGVPERISKDFLSLLKNLKSQVVFMAHINCIEELDDDVIFALKQIALLGTPIFVQTVLTKGVNDTFSMLKSLFLGCISQGFIPYYLHQLDKVKGAAHFEVSQLKGHALIQELRESLPGYAIPTYVEEIPKKKSKTPLNILN